MILKKGMTLAVIGDTVSDGGRFSDPRGLGKGYPRILADVLAAKYPEYGISVHNRASAFRRSGELAEIWKEDCVALHPDVAVMMVGIEDTRFAMDRGIPSDPDEYEENVGKMMSITRECGAELLVLEPFLLPVGYPLAGWYEWNDDLSRKLVRLRVAAQRYGCAAYIPLHGLFAAFAAEGRAEEFSSDGIHLTPAGHRFAAERILYELEK